MTIEEEQAALLAHETFIADLLRRRSPPKRWWESSALISSGTAILTVAVTSLAAFVTQKEIRDRDLVQHRQEVALAAEESTLQRAHLLATEAMHYSDERFRLRTGAYSGLKPEQVRRLIDSVNASDAMWRQGRYSEHLSMALQFIGFPELVAAWDSLARTLDHYSACSVEPPVNGCSALRVAVDTSLQAFGTAVIAHIQTHTTNFAGDFHKAGRQRRGVPPPGAATTAK